MTAKLVAIPSDLPALDDDGEPILDEKDRPAVIRFIDFVRSRTRDRAFAADMKEGFTLDDLEAAQEVRKGCTEAILTGGTWLVDGDHHARLCRAIKKPHGGWPPNMAPQMLLFAHAVLDAKDAPASLPNGSESKKRAEA